MEEKTHGKSVQHQPEKEHHQMDQREKSSKANTKYWRFAAMIVTSVVIMHLLTFANVSRLDHIYFSQVRIYMSIMMGSVMAIVMLLFMKQMYTNKKLNQKILIGSALIFFLMFWMIQNQIGISDVSWMRSMIPHHSSAIMTSENANITDPEVQKLADEIIQAQEEEIAEMRRMIEQLQSQP